MRKGFAVFLMIFTAFVSFAQETGEWYQGKPIRNIVFDGLLNVRPAELDGITEPYIGRLFDDDIFWELQGKLYALEYFEMISPSAVPADDAGNAVIIRFQVTERPTVGRINFSGNSHLRRTELLNTIALKVNDVVTQLKLRADEQALINKYLEKGYPDIKIRTETLSNKDNGITVTFFIEEGEKISIEAFHFEGISSFSERTLRGQLSLKAKGIINDGAFQEAKLIADRNTLTQYYHDRGYIDAEIIDVIQEINKDEKGANNMIITFRIYEGRIYNFGGITFSGNKIFTTTQLSALIRSRGGEVVNARRVEADLQRVADLYLENGYLFNTISNIENRNMEEGTISYEIAIVERNRAHIENILVQGNNKTKDYVILREIPLEPGDIFSKAKVMDAYRNLYNLQFFSNVVVDTPPGSADSLMDLIFNVEEQPTTNIQFGVTFSGSADPNKFPMALIFQFQDRNFLGYGNTLGAGLNASLDTQSTSINYTQRWMFGLPLSGGFDLTVGHTERQAYMDNTKPFFNGDEADAYPDGFNNYQDYLNSNAIPPAEFLMKYQQWSVSLGFSTGYRWTTFLGNLGLNGGVRTAFVYNSYDETLYRPFDPVLRNHNKGLVPALSLWSSLTLDKRDIYYDPSNGYYFTERFGIYGLLPRNSLGEWIEREYYLQTDTKTEYFFTLFDLPITEKWSFKSVFGIHTGLSFILPQYGRPDGLGQRPVIEQANLLAIDGMFIGRGWSDETRLATRGEALWENWAELRFPLVPGMLSWDFIFDAASWAKTPQMFFNQTPGELLNSMYFSFGGGLRISIPQFPFRFLFTKGFRVIDGEFQWKRGLLGGTNDPASGIDFVLSISLSTY